MWGREEWRTRGDDLRTFLADFVSFLSQLRRWIKSTAYSGAIGDMCGVEMWRGGLGAAYCCRPFRLPVPHARRRAEPAAVYIAPPLGPQLSPPKTALRLDARLLPDSRHRRQHCLRWLSLRPKPATVCRAGICGHRVHGIFDSDSSWPPGIACAGVVVIFFLMELAVSGMHRHLTSPLCSIKVEALSSDRVVLSRPRDIWPPPTSPTVSICTSPCGL